MKLRIKTLGDFDIKIGEESLLKETNKSYRLLKLLQYFITFRNKKLLPDTLIDNLWDNNESNDPKNMLRAQIFRLRQIIEKFLPADVDHSKYMNIIFNNGYYTLEIGELTVIDIEVFETLILNGDNNIVNDIDKTIESYKSALSIYKGSFLGENSNDIWIVQVRNYYRRLYLKTLFKLLDLYKENEQHDRIIEVCEEAIYIEPNEESIHIYMMEAMLKLDQVNNALSYFEFISTIFEKERGTNASPAMRNINRKIQNYFAEKGEIDMINIKNKLEDELEDGPLCCDADYFKFLFNIQKRKRIKSETPDFISLITLNCEYICLHDNLIQWDKMMKVVLNNTLRKGDVYSFWNDSQILVLLQNVKQQDIENIKTRIRNNILSIDKINEFNISIKFIPISIEDKL